MSGYHIEPDLNLAQTSDNKSKQNKIKTNDKKRSTVRGASVANYRDIKPTN